MNLSRCANGHFFDKEKYTTCPHCAGGASADDSLTTVFTEDVNPAGMPAAPLMPDAFSTPAKEGTVPVDFAIEDTLPTAPLAESHPTMPLSDVHSFDTPTVPLSEAEGIVASTASMSMDSDDDDHTVAFFDDVFSNVAPASSASAVVKKENTVSSPCVGWLIAIGGVHIGQDFRLKVGKNFIGRDETMDVAMTGDKSVSRNRHAIVVYEPKQHLYLIQPGESSALVYCNDEVVLGPVKLKPYDIITIGEVNLLFLPLCGEQFNWSALFEEMSKKTNE
ncbi:MAG: FHA domain-containing protein [Roseburia sp.]|nr:FHA domain-containing protein [Roseburia sp.]